MVDSWKDIGSWWAKMKDGAIAVRVRVGSNGNPETVGLLVCTGSEAQWESIAARGRNESDHASTSVDVEMMPRAIEDAAEAAGWGQSPDCRTLRLHAYDPDGKQLAPSFHRTAPKMPGEGGADDTPSKAQADSIRALTQALIASSAQNVRALETTTNALVQRDTMLAEALTRMVDAKHDAIDAQAGAVAASLEAAMEDAKAMQDAQGEDALKGDAMAMVQAVGEKLGLLPKGDPIAGIVSDPAKVDELLNRPDVQEAVAQAMARQAARDAAAGEGAP